ncbi:MAG: phosphate signaling complex protein PhoU [Planctomycetaceae bacterium]
MSIHLQRDLDALHRDLLTMSGLVEEMIHQAVDALSHPSEERAKALRARDEEIDRWDVRIEDECLKTLALNQPVAGDLRRVSAVLRMTAEVERVGDLAVHVAERACGLIPYPQMAVPEKLKRMGDVAADMFHRAIGAYVELDAQLARDVRATDDIVDELNRQIIRDLLQLMRAQPELIDPAMHMFSASKNIERVADHSTKISKDVVYLVEGALIRHRWQT